MENSTPFNLNQSIQRWRDTLAQSAAFRPDDLDQLETHLRDSIATHQARGLSLQDAFYVAKGRLGANDELTSEFAKINPARIWQDRVLWMLIGFLLIKFVGALASILSNLTLLFIHSMTTNAHLLGTISAVASFGAYMALLLGIWRLGTVRPGLSSRLLAWMQNHPILVAIGMLSLGPIASLPTTLTLRTMPPSTFAVVSFYSAVQSMLLHIVLPVIFAWLLIRTRQKPGLRPLQRLT